MNLEPKSIAEQIECLARLTGAPASFVSQVRRLFRRKGIPLHTDATPYLKALEEAFRREETIRAGARRAQGNIRQLRKNFDRLGKTYVQQLEQLRRLQRGLDTSRRQAARRTRAGRFDLDHRSLITRTQREDLPMVPGPEEDQ